MSENNIEESFLSRSSEFDVGVQDSDKELLVKAHELYDSGRYQEVILYFSQQQQLSNSAHAQVLLANAYLSSGDEKSAMNHWKKAAEISPLAPFSYINMANYYYGKGKIHDAILNWTIATTIVPENPKINLNLALAYDKINNRVKATKFFEKFLKYETDNNSSEYILVKHKIGNMLAKIEFYAKKVEEMKLQKDLKAIAALYLKMIATYALVPAVYGNIAEIFSFDKNYQKALEFYQLVYLYFPFTNKILIEIANICYMLRYNSYAYAYYKRAITNLPEGTSYYAKISNLINSLSSVANDAEVLQSHLSKAKEAAANCDYEVAIDEYEIYLTLTESDSPELQQIIDRYKIFVNPEPFVISVLYNQIPELMNKRNFEACIEVCDRIITMSKEHSKEVVAAIKYKSDCKRILAARENHSV